MKPKKIPQRGLGVAQLEKIRLEEQQRKEASSLLSFRPQPLPQITTLPPSPPQPPVIIDLKGMPRGAEAWVPKPYSDGSKALAVQGKNHNWSKLCDNGGDHHQHGKRVPQNLNMVNELNTRNSSQQCVLQRSQHCQHLSSSSMVKVSAGISSSAASSELNFQTEPPSNQNYCVKNYTPRWPDEEVKMAGIKRQCPFSSEYPISLASFTCKYPPSPGYTPPISKTYESSDILTRGPSNSDSLSAPITRRLCRENEGFDGDFLTLAPPMASSPHIHLGSGEELIGRPVMSGSDQPLIHGFCPLTEQQVGQEATPNECKGEVSGGVDLNLRL
ncbi:unnamed protein product [Cuscuta campestris]|uniref:Uncharacterized protein n=1 Tax=Cuscuta campestris TaxID=132261 RepID=A0A484LR21_9ASTE|nr:unnamed protein product [Cuscuta campestris]